MQFERRDAILLAGTIMVILGMAPFMALVYAIIIGGAIFFAIKWFVYSRKRFVEKNIKEGICAECGEKIVNKKCPNCDAKSE